MILHILDKPDGANSRVLLYQQGRATQKKHEAEQQEKRLKKQISELKDKERTHPSAP